MSEASAGERPARRNGPFGAVLAFDGWLKGPAMRWAALPVQLALRVYVFFALPFVDSGLTKWQVFPFLKPVPWAWNGWPTVSAAAQYQFSKSCDFCFNVRVWGSEQDPLVQWVLPFPEAMAALAGLGEIIFPTLILVGLATRPSALGLLGMTVVIQLVIPTGLPVHAAWAAVFLAIVAVGPGLLSLDALFGRLIRR